ncbi:DUF3010 family protein [Vibrio brasiliensis]|jgi:hypothetical protein|uniref:DUF3010 domain-containing protein n=1 Tax=Vibrio brasiliensis LMG 20546 TaxID=945543 RepID=E8LYD7_9VIBR|nr:DUF3010 family protein [Vibrio brasiliensis]EGA64225.1 hypothetical protein VIBR0546_02790 [Vibrio brasiliensis LMG 20546]MCG9648035.1 DUF3010 family protein [Vibrio brasiliensis]MCG9753480.1 DUF3010 family protein [Vibrio brasiliensis]MCG9781509.1 DUF3010 family protein [Vibrio brasiliensis]
MKICGVELKGNDAVICLLSHADSVVHLPDCRVAKLTIGNANDTQEVKKFQFSFAKLIQDYQIEKVVIRQRQTKGKFAGGAVGFKLEAAIQLIEGIDVKVVSPTEIKESLKRNPLAIQFKETGLKQYQEQAFTTAYACAMMRG